MCDARIPRGVHVSSGLREKNIILATPQLTANVEPSLPFDTSYQAVAIQATSRPVL